MQKQLGNGLHWYFSKFKISVYKPPTNKVSIIMWCYCLPCSPFSSFCMSCLTQLQNLWLWLCIYCIREKDIDISFAQDAIDEYKVILLANCVFLLISLLSVIATVVVFLMLPAQPHMCEFVDSIPPRLVWKIIQSGFVMTYPCHST